MNDPLDVEFLAFGNRAFYGMQTDRGNVVVIDSPREVAASLVPVEPARDVVVHGAYMAEPVAATLLRSGFRATIGVDAGGGRNGAGYGGLPVADRYGVPAAVASVFSCEMCVGASVWRDGVISHANAAAAACGVEPGHRVADAAERMLRSELGQVRDVRSGQPDDEFILKQGEAGSIFGCWSMGIPKGNRRADVFCVGTPLDTMMAVYVHRHHLNPRGVIGSDGGFGRNQMAVAGLHILQSIGVPAAAVGHLSADLGNAQSIYRDGVVTLANARAESAGVHAGQRALDAADLLLPHHGTAIPGRGFSPNPLERLRAGISHGRSTPCLM